MAGEDTENVRVAVRIRPMNSAELAKRCRPVVHGDVTSEHVALGEHHQFTFDKVFPSMTQQTEVFDETVKDLVEGSMKGRNATVLAYGQTGSGKTYTMGTGCEVGLKREQEGVLPRSARWLFSEMDRLRAKAKGMNAAEPEFLVQVSFLELYQGKFYDLFEVTPGTKKESNIKIRDEKIDGVLNIHISGVTQHNAESVEDIMSLLQRGSLARETGSTCMNQWSSRSHAIFTLWITHRRLKSILGTSDTEAHDDDLELEAECDQNFITTTAKFNFVDLAGSERLKRTQAVGERAREGIDINSGLLALGNVISALGDPLRRGVHVPYRNNKLTRILQDSLGGNSRTLMLACVSPADDDLVETLSTLKYANRARNIQNKVVVNQDSASREIQFLRETIQKLQIEIHEYRSGRIPINPDSEEANDVYREVTYLRQRNQMLVKQVEALEKENDELRRQMVSMRVADLSADNFDVDAKVQDVINENENLKHRVTELEAMIGALEAHSESGSPVQSPTRPQTAWVNDLKRYEQITKMGHDVLEHCKASLHMDFEAEQNSDIRHDSSEEAEHKSESVADDDDEDLMVDDDQDDDQMVEDERLDDFADMVQNQEEDAADDAPTSAVTEPLKRRTESAHEGSVIHQELMKQLGLQITMHEELLAKLEHTNKELEKQKELYENRLGQAQDERKKIESERDRLRNALADLAGEQTGKAKKERKEYEKQLKELHKNIKRMDRDKQLLDRMEADRKRAASQIEILQKSIEDAKLQRKDIMKDAQEEMKRNRAEREEQNREIYRLRRENVKTKNEAVKWERLAKNKDITRARTLEENKRLKQELDLTKKGKLRHHDIAEGEESTFQTKTPTWRKLRRQTVKKTDVSAQRKQTKLLQEVQRAVQYAMIKKRISELIDKRDRELSQKRDELKDKRDKIVAVAGDDDSQAREIAEDLDRIETEIDYITEALRDEQSDLLSLETAGIRSCLDNDEISENGVKLISDLSLPEAKYLLKAFFSALVRNHLASERTKLRVKELEMETDHKDTILNSLALGAFSIEDLNLPSQKKEIEIAAPLPPNLDATLDESQDLFETPNASPVHEDRPRSKTTEDVVLASLPADAEEENIEADDDEKLSIRQRAVSASREVRRRAVSAVSTGLARLTRRTNAETQRLQARDEEAPTTFSQTLRLEKRRRKAEALLEEIVAERKHLKNESQLNLTHTIQGFRDEVLCVSVLDNVLVTGSKDRTARIWDLNQNKLTHALDAHEYHVHAVAQVPFQIFSVTRNIVRKWDARTCSEVGKFTIRHKGHIRSIQVDSDRSTMYIAADQYLRIWDLRMEQELKCIKFKGKIDTLSLSPDKKMLSFSTIDHKIRMLDVTHMADGELVVQSLQPPHFSRVKSLSFLSDNVLFSGSEDCSIKKWVSQDAQWYNRCTITGAHVGRTSEGVAVSALCPISPLAFVSGSARGSLKLWDAATAVALEEHQEHADYIHDITFQNNRLFTASADKTVKIWSYVNNSDRSRRDTMVLNEATLKAGTPLIDELARDLDECQSVRSDTTFDIDPDVQRPWTVDTTFAVAQDTSSTLI